MPGGQMNWNRVRRENRAKEARSQGYGETLAHLATLPGRGCWCGKKLGHSWAGKDDGAPHPRD